MSKTALRVMAMGDVGELDSAVGMLLAFGVNGDEDLQTRELLRTVQQDLLDLGGELSIPGYELLKSQRVAALDEWLRRKRMWYVRYADVPSAQPSRWVSNSLSMHLSFSIGIDFPTCCSCWGAF